MTILMKKILRRLRRPLAVALALIPGMAMAGEPKPLWPDGAPGAKGDAPADVPTLTHHPVREDLQTGIAVIVCPGGGYGGLALDHEGDRIAAWLNKHGIHASILKYRHAPAYRHPIPKQDVQRAVRTLRHRARHSRGAIQTVGVLGFSAGGHLAATAATQFDDGDPEADDEIERESSRPDFAVLCYPVITLGGKYAHKGSRRNLLGDNPPFDLVDRMSMERNVTAKTPPVFLWHTADDQAVPVQNSLLFYDAMAAVGIPGELHVFQSGRHGLGLAPDNPDVAAWADLCITWIKNTKTGTVPFFDSKDEN